MREKGAFAFSVLCTVHGVVIVGIERTKCELMDMPSGGFGGVLTQSLDPGKDNRLVIIPTIGRIRIILFCAALSFTLLRLLFVRWCLSCSPFPPLFFLPNFCCHVSPFGPAWWFFFCFPLDVPGE